MTHTQGPWTFVKGNGVMFVRGPKAPDMAYAMDVTGEDYTGYGDDEQREANLKLIAAAPELFDVAATTVSFLEVMSTSILQHMTVREREIASRLLNAANAAIAKAKGQQ